jgi:hypothetical protein
MSEGCELLVQEMEDIIPTPKNLLQGDIKSIEIAVLDLLKAEINSLHDFEKFITFEQKKVRLLFSETQSNIFVLCLCF